MLSISFSSAQKLKIPVDYTIITEKYGDLDGDKIDEKVVVYNTSELGDAGTVREIQLFKKNETNQWTLWKSSKNAIRQSNEGGQRGEPFEDISIKNGVLEIYHSGGTSWRWYYTDKYKFQNNEFQLIGYTHTYGKECENFTTVDVNISTGKATYNKIHVTCTNNISKIVKKIDDISYNNKIKLSLKTRNIKIGTLFFKTIGKEVNLF